MASDFNQISSKIFQLRGQNNRDLINSTLKQLNSLNYKYQIVLNPTKGTLLIHQCCSLILPEDAELVLQCCQLITNLIEFQSVKLEGRTFNLAVSWCLNALNGIQAVQQVLVALNSLLHESTNNEFLSEIFNNCVFIQIAKQVQRSHELFYALQCLESCCTHFELIPQYNQITFEIFRNHLVENFMLDNLLHIKIIIVCLRGLQNLVKKQPDLLVTDLGTLLGIIKAFMLVGLDVAFAPPQKLNPSPLSLPESTVTIREKGGKMTKVRKPKTQAGIMKVTNDSDISISDVLLDIGMPAITSDSDFSDSEFSTAKLVKMTAKLRQTSLILFLQTIKVTNSTTVFTYWSSFIPENFQTNKNNLITCILKETTNKGRMAALNVLLMLLSVSKKFLLQAEKSDNLSFTSFSVVLGLSLKEIYQCLSLSLSAMSVPVLTLLLKCFSAVIQATPFHRLSSGLLSKAVRNIKPFLYHKDSTVQVSALIAFGCILSSEPSIKETEEALMKHLNNEIPWLLDRCFRNLGYYKVGNDVVPTSVQLESLQIISIMSRNYFEIFLAPNIEILTNLLDSTLLSKYQDVQLHSAIAINFIGQAITKSSNQVDYVNFWQILLNNSLTRLLQNEQNSNVRAICCDCLSSIGDLIFEQFSRDKQILCVTLLFSCSNDDDFTVKGAAVRALAILVFYPSLRDDMGFVIDTAQTIYRVLQENIYILKMKSSWALGNLSDALVTFKLNNHPVDDFPDALLIKLLRVTLNEANNSDKIRMNIVRALGNFLQLFESNLLENKEFYDLTLKAIEILMKNSAAGTNMKVRWNSCYAIGNAMKNSNLFLIKTGWENDIYRTLITLVTDCQNFKVRINAAAALAAPRKREFYGPSYQLIITSLIKGLSTADNNEDFNEFKHKDNLIEQICLTIGYLLTLAIKEDLTIFQFIANSDHFQTVMRRVWENALPEKTSILFDAYTHLMDLNSNDLNTNEKELVNYLIIIFKQEFF